MIPILVNHDQSAVIGMFDNGVISLKPDSFVTIDMIKNIGPGFRVLEMHEVDGVVYVDKFELHEFSVYPIEQRKKEVSPDLHEHYWREVPDDPARRICDTCGAYDASYVKEVSP